MKKLTSLLSLFLTFALLIFYFKIPANIVNASLTNNYSAINPSPRKALSYLTLFVQSYILQIFTDLLDDSSTATSPNTMTLITNTSGNVTVRSNTTYTNISDNVTVKPNTTYINTTSIQIIPEANTKYVALTFDDGPNSSLTPKLLDALEKYNAKVTFFIVGNMVNNSKDVVKRAYDLGNEIGSHSYDHKDFTILSNTEIINQVNQTSAIIKSVTGTNPTLIRVPYGTHDDNVNSKLKSLGLPIILWNVDPIDWDCDDANLVYERVKDNLDDGNIVLMHDTHPTSIDAAVRILKDYSNNGYKFVTISELAALKKVQLIPGGTYFNF
ncbi:MAG: polysaccharide deacetylase family protein [Oscillospiraceae bacterium]|nr:polysaccharide deacetylase family protein [Oscillospiraceae bacterium]